jgi:hypothetical protein
MTSPLTRFATRAAYQLPTPSTALRAAPSRESGFVPWRNPDLRLTTVHAP